MRLPNQGTGQFVPGEAYDPTLKEIFISDPDVNAVEAYSTVDGHRIGEILVPGPAGLSFSPDFAQLVVGTISPYVYFADPAKLEVTGQIALPPSMLAADQMGSTLMPVVPYAMADGSILLAMGVTPESSSSAETFVVHTVKYSPASQTFSLVDPSPGGVSATPVRSGDGKFLLSMGISNSNLVLFLYSTSAQGYTATSSSLQNAGTFLAANADGSQFASVQNSKVMFWSSTLNAENTYTASFPVNTGPIYSRDGKYLYVVTQNVLYALNAQTGSPTGYLGLSVGSLFPLPQLFDVDETYHLFGAMLPGGAMMINASQLQTTVPTNLAQFTGPSTEANPNVGALSGNTQVQFIPAPTGSGSADGIADSMEAYFGSTPATQDVVAPYPASSDGENFLTATAPAASTSGPVSVLLTDANNNPVFLPDAYTYGPHLLRAEPNTASAAGGDEITLFAYGLGFFDLNEVSITVGGAAVDMQKATLNSYASSTYPEQSVTFAVPAGTPGWADIVLTMSDGTDTLKRAIQYLPAEAAVGTTAFGFAVYDSARDRFYLTGNGNTVAVFDPNSQTMLQSLQAAGVSSSAVLQGEALTPDDSKLLVSDPADQLVVIFDLPAGTSTTVKVVLPSDPTVTLSAPMSVVTAAGNRAFVSLSPCITDPVREIDLSTLSVQVRSDAASACTTYVPYPQLGGSSADGSTIVFAGNNEVSPPGPEYLWRYDASSDTFTGPVIFADRPWQSGKASVDANGGMIALSQGVLDQRLLPLVPLGMGWLDSQLNETGSLLYSVSGGSSVFVSDTHNGHQLLTLNLPPATGPSVGPYRPLAIDPTGKKILVATQSGIYYSQLGVIPLAVGTVSPPQGPPGTVIQLRGSGFISGAAVQIGGQTAPCNVVDSETMSCTVPNLSPGQPPISITNPDGQSYSFDNAFAVQ